MKLLLIGLLALGSLSIFAQSTTTQSVTSGESINFEIQDCDANEFGLVKLLDNTKVSISCEAKICLQYQEGNALGVVWGKLYLVEGNKKTFLSEYKGRKEKSADSQIKKYMEDNVCKNRIFEGVKL
jgi:hypothetical protein